MGALSDFTEKRFGVLTRYRDTPLANSVGIGIAQIWRNNPDRLELMFVNLGANVIYINTHVGVSATNGFYLGANGGSITLTAEHDGELVGYAWWAYAAAATPIFSAEIEGQ